MTEYVSIKKEVLQKLAENLPDIMSRFGVSQIRLFGSVACGEDTAESDIDLLYIFSPEFATYDNLFDLHEYLTGLFGRKVDLISEKWSGERFLNSALHDAYLIKSDKKIADV